MAKARIKCQKCGTFNYIHTTFCVSCGDKLTHQPEHTVITEKIPKLPKGEAKKKADFYAPDNKNKPKPEKKQITKKNRAAIAALGKTLLFSLTIIFVGLLIYPPKIYSPEPTDSDLESFEKKAETYMSGKINSTTFTSEEIAAFLHVKALQPTIIQNNEGKIYFIFPSRVRLSISPKFFKLYLYMKVYGIEVVVGIKGEVVVKRDGHLYLTLKKISLGRMPVPKAALSQMIKSIAVAFKYPLPDQIADIFFREDAVTIVSQTMRSPKRRVRREKTDSFIYEETASETEYEETNDIIDDDEGFADEDIEDDSDMDQDEIMQRPKFKIKPRNKNIINKQISSTEDETSEEDQLPAIADIDEDEPIEPVVSEKPKKEQKKKIQKTANTLQTQQSTLTEEEKKECRKFQLKGDFLYNRKQYRTALIYYKKIIALYPGYEEINKIKNRIDEIEANNS